MDAKRCDRCGSYYLRSQKKHYVNGVEYNIDGIVFWASCGRCKAEYSQMDLCDDCIGELIEFLKNKKGV